MHDKNTATKEQHTALPLAVCSSLLVLALSACGGGGGGGGSGGGSGTGGVAAIPSYISAVVLSFPSDSVPNGFSSTGTNSAVLVQVKNTDSNGATVSNANVLVNGANLAYSASAAGYFSEMNLNPGGSVTLSVSANGQTYTASGFQQPSYPTITNPVSGSSWNTGNTNVLRWLGTATGSNALYLLGVMDTSAHLVWPGPSKFQSANSSNSSYAINAHTLSIGNRVALVGQSSIQNIANAAPDSFLSFTGFGVSNFSVTGSAAVQPDAQQPAPSGFAMQPAPLLGNLSMQAAARAVLETQTRE